MNTKFLSLFLFLLLLSSVFATTSITTDVAMLGVVEKWSEDSIKDGFKIVDKETQVITINNESFKPQAKLKLVSPQSVRVGVGYQNVAEFEITGLEELTSFIKSIKTYDAKKFYNYKEKEFDIKRKIVYRELVDTVAKDCLEPKDEFTEPVCTDKKVKSWVTKTKYEDLEKLDLKKGETIIVALFTNVEFGERVEWVPEVLGVYVSEWAEWYNDPSNLIAWFPFDGNATDMSGHYGDSNVFGATLTTGVNGVADTAYQFQDTATWIDVNDGRSVPVFELNDINTTNGVYSITFNDDGTKMYFVENYRDLVFQYNLETPYDETTAVFYTRLDLSKFDSSATGLTFNDDGSIMYYTGATADFIYQFNLSSNFDINSWSGLPSGYYYFGGVATGASSPKFTPNGTKFYLIDNTIDSVVQYSLGTAWNVSTATLDYNFYVGDRENLPAGLFFNEDGNLMFINGTQADRIIKYVLSDDWNVLSAIYDSNFSVVGKETASRGVFFNPDGNLLFFAGDTADSVFRYTLTDWNLASATYDSNLNLSFNRSTTSQDLYLSPNGINLYTIDSTKDIITQWILGTPYDITTAGYVREFGVSTKERFGTGIYFNSDGNIMFYSGRSSDRVYKYVLGTPWDLSTAVYDSNTSILGCEADSGALAFSADGTKLFITEYTTNDQICRYSLGGAWDLTTVTNDQNFSVAGQETSAQGLVFNSTGEKLWITGNNADSIFEYDLATPYDLSTMSYANLRLYTWDSTPIGITIGDSDSKLYVITNTSETIQQYNLRDVGTLQWSDSPYKNGYTISYWINMKTNTTPTTEVSRIMGKGSSGVSGYTTMIRTDQNQVQFGTDKNVFYYNTSTLANEWVFITASEDVNGNQKLYKNGVLLSESFSDIPTNTVIEFRNLVLGAIYNISWVSANAKIDDIRIYNTDLNQDQITELILQYDLNTTTTTLTRTTNPTNGDQAIITLTCTPISYADCNTTYYIVNGGLQQTYTSPFNLNVGTYTIDYYSVSTNGITEPTNQTTFTILPEAEMWQKILRLLPAILQLGFILLLNSIILVLLSQMLLQNETITKIGLIIGACAIIMIFLSLLL